MYIVEKSLKLSENVYEIWVNAPHVTRNAKAGQFVIIRTDDKGERIPLTISKISGDLVRIIFMAVGKTTHALAEIPAGGFISDIAGPLGCPSKIKKYGILRILPDPPAKRILFFFAINLSCNRRAGKSHPQF